MILKDGKAITIENKDVQRIRMLGEIVWEKTRATILTLASSTNSTSFVNSFILTATLKDVDNNPIDGTINFYDGDTLIGNAKTTITNNTSTATFVINSNDIRTHEYHAVFNKTDKFKESTSSNISVVVKKDTPTLTQLGTTTSIYNEWDVGVQLKDSMNNPIKSKSITLSNGVSGTKTTNTQGKVTTTISGKSGALTIKYTFSGDSLYNSVTKTVTYTVNTSMTAKALSPAALVETDDKAGPYNYGKSGYCKYPTDDKGHSTINQKWATLSLTGTSQCGVENCKGGMIGAGGSNGGTWQRACKLKASFPHRTEKIKSMTFSYNDKKAKGWSNGGMPAYGQTTLTWNSIEKTKTAPDKDYAGTVKKVSWNVNKVLSSNPNIYIYFARDTKGETGIIYLKNIKLTYNYIPVKETL